MKVKHQYNCPFSGLLQYLHNGDLMLNNRQIPASDMRKVADAYSGANRIHKPFALLFWIDCKNGKAGDWKDDKQLS